MYHPTLKKKKKISLGAGERKEKRGGPEMSWGKKVSQDTCHLSHLGNHSFMGARRERGKAAMDEKERGTGLTLQEGGATVFKAEGEKGAFGPALDQKKERVLGVQDKQGKKKKTPGSVLHKNQICRGKRVTPHGKEKKGKGSSP